MATPSDDFFIQKVILLMTGVPGTVLLRDQITQLYGETRDLNKVSAFIDDFMSQRTLDHGGNIQEGVHFLFDNGFGLELTPQKIDQLTADSLREGIDTWSELFFHLTDEAEINLDQILDNRADAADLFTDILAELNANIDINDPLVHQWIDKVDGSALTLQEAKIAARALIDQLIAAPTLIERTPVDGAIDVPVAQNITLNFDEAIKAGNGNIEIIGENENPRSIPITDTSQITFEGALLTINPLLDLSPNKNYYVLIANGVITDLSGNPFGGINDPALFNFRTIETDPPILISRDPPDEGINIEVSKDIILTFNEPIKAGNGNIVISGENEAPRIISMTDASQVAINGSTITINPLQDLSPDKNYHIEVTNDAITDLAGNPFVGISDSTSWIFKTIDTLPPTLISSDPLDNATNIGVDKDIVLTFSEAIKGGSGNIQIIDEFEEDTRLISVSDTSQVTINGNTITINPTDDLKFGVNYSVLISPGTITDLNANPYEGIDDASNLNFITNPLVNLPPVIQPPTQPFTYIEAILDDGLLTGQIDDVNDVIGTVVATGRNPIATYNIIAGNESGYFAIDRNGHLTLTPAGLTGASNDFEILPNQYKLTITASDLTGASSDGVGFQINVQNNPADDDITPPIFTSSPIASPINENIGAGQIIYTATTDDPAASYSLSAVDVDTFSIESNTGAVRLLANPDFESKNNYTFTVIATDKAIIPNASQQAVSLAINDIDDTPPIFPPPPPPLSIDENSGAGQIIYTATTDDPAATYSLTGADADSFSIESTGVVRLPVNPDFETKSNYTFNVKASDSIGNSSEQPISLAIIDDVNEGQEFNLVVGEDNLTGTAGNDVFIAGVSQNNAGNSVNTLENIDKLDGGAGPKDTLAATLDGGSAAPLLNSIENVLVRFASAATLDLANATGVQTVTVQSSTDAGAVEGIGDAADLAIRNQKQDVIFIGNTATSLNLDLDAFGDADTPNTVILDDGATTLNLSATNAFASIVGLTSVETLNVNATGTNVVTQGSGGVTTAATITGTGSVELVTPFAVLETLTATDNSGGVTATVNGAAVTVNGGSGNDDITYTAALAADAAVNLGAGDDSLTIAGISTAGATADAGEGIADTLAVTNGTWLNADAADVYSNFETLEIGGGTGTYDMENLPGLTAATIGAALAGNAAITNAVADATITVNAAESTDLVLGNDLDYALADATGTTDAASLTLNALDGNDDTSADGLVFVDSFAASDIETFNIVSNISEADAEADATDYFNTITALSGDAVETINLSGTAGLEINGLTPAALNKINASTLTGALTVDASAADGVEFIGGAGNDDYTGTDGGDTIMGNGGADTITLGAGAVDTILLNAATDSQLNATLDGHDIITGFGVAGQLDVIDVGAAGFTGQQISELANKGELANLEVDVSTLSVENFFASGDQDRGVAIGTNEGDTFVFVDANKDGNFTATDDVVLQLDGVIGVTLANIAF